MKRPLDIAAIDEITAQLLPLGVRLMQSHLVAPTIEQHVSYLQQCAQFDSESSVLDMGAGVGEVAKLMTEADPSLRFTLVNLSALQLEHAPQGVAKWHCDFQRLPCEDGAFDAAMFCFSIGQADLKTSLTEAYRAIRSGGVLFIFDMVRKSGANEAQHRIGSEIHDAFTVFDMAKAVGFHLTYYEEPTVFGSSTSIPDLNQVLDEAFAGTVPAIWRFKKP